MALNLFGQHEKSFLEAKAREWGWRDDNAMIFVGRMLSGNSKLSNVLLGEDLELRNEHRDLIPNKVADTLSRNIMPKLKQEAGIKEDEKWDWKGAQIWLQEKVFPVWIKPLAWQELWVSGKPNPDIAVEIIKQPLVAGMRPPASYAPYQVPIGAEICYQIPMSADEYLILLEKDGDNNIYCLQPSKHQKYGVGEPIATSELIAIVSVERPQVDWWNDAASAEFLLMEHQQLEALMNWTNNARNNCRLWQFEVEIVMPKVEAVAINI